MTEREPEIRRIDVYDDPRFSKTVLRQHGAFLVDGTPCEVEIIGADSAVVRNAPPKTERYLIETFRFYAEHIRTFLNEQGASILEFPPVALFTLKLSEIQPSQFYVDEEKLQAVRTFLSEPKDIVIPVLDSGGRYISLDGHTRMAAAVDLGFDTVFAFLSSSGADILDFAQEAYRRGVRTPYDLKRVPHEEYEIVWNQFCDDFFKENIQKGQEK